MTDVSPHTFRRPAVDTTVATAPATVSVLIVDDDDRYVSFVGQAFESSPDSDIQLIHVRRLSEIWRVLRTTPIAVVLLDVELPDGNGLEWLRQNRSRLESAVIVLTGHAEYNREAELDVAQDFMVKWEVEPAHLVRAVRYAAD